MRDKVEIECRRSAEGIWRRVRYTTLLTAVQSEEKEEMREGWLTFGSVQKLSRFIQPSNLLLSINRDKFHLFAFTVQYATYQSCSFRVLLLC